MCHIMARGSSGRIVVDMDPQIKGLLHARLAEEGLTLKDWFMHHVGSYLEDRSHPTLFPPEELKSFFGATNESKNT
jgi:hypothetical protein